MNYVIAGPVGLGPLVRREEEEDLLKHIVTRQKLYIPLCCARQTGKTTLMYQLRARLHAQGFGVSYLYLGNLSKLSEAGFYQHICKMIGDRMSGCLESKARSNTENVKDQPSFLEYMEWTANNSKGCQGIVIMLDEVGGVPGEFADSFWGGLRSMYTQGTCFERLMFVLAGELDMRKLATGNNSPLANVCISPMVDLKDLHKKQVEELVALHLPREDALVNAIHGWTAGHPYLTQKLCALVKRTFDSKQAETETAEKLVTDLVKKYFVQQDDPNLTHVYNELREESRYRERVRNVLVEPRKATPAYNDLAVLGVVKRNEEGLYMVRNRIYEEALTSFLEDYNEEE